MVPSGVTVTQVGLYSAAARRPLAAARAFIAERGYRPTADDIRTCRQELIGRGGLPPFRDFSSTSGCRDLLFHACEHHFTIPRIKSLLQENGLDLIGFALDADAQRQLQGRFLGQDATANLDLLHVFETENPQTFSTMYDFWVVKAA